VTDGKRHDGRAGDIACGIGRRNMRDRFTAEMIAWWTAGVGKLGVAPERLALSMQVLDATARAHAAVRDRRLPRHQRPSRSSTRRLKQS